MSDDIIKRLREAIAAIDDAESPDDHQMALEEYRRASAPYLMHEVLSMIDRLRAENAALAADARRYRFIRDADRSDAFLPIGSLLCYAMDSLDAAIDAAMAAERGKE